LCGLTPGGLRGQRDCLQEAPAAGIFAVLHFEPTVTLGGKGGQVYARILEFAMCRSIKVLRHESIPATAEEIAAASLQFVRKVSGYRKPSKANQEAFDAAVRDIAATTDRLLQVVADNYPSDGVARRSGS
jgi:hypothetical protein